MNYSGKKVLVTAGPTWVKIDRVRVLTSIFSGETGLRFARHFKELGADVTLLMGPGRARFVQEDFESMDVNYFTYYEDLDELLQKQLRDNSYDVIIHSSAVSDYNTVDKYDGKLASGNDAFRIDLTTTAKLVDYIREAAPDSFLVKFKLQVGTTKEELFDIALNSVKVSNAELIVANDLEHMDGENHVAYIIDQEGNSLEARTKEEMCKSLSDEISKRVKS